MDKNKVFISFPKFLEDLGNGQALEQSHWVGDKIVSYFFENKRLAFQIFDAKTLLPLMSHEEITKSVVELDNGVENILQLMIPAKENMFYN